MHVISRKKLRAFAAEHPEATTALDSWYSTAKQAEWGCFADLRDDFASADMVGRFVVFNVAGHKVRLVAEVFFSDRVVLVREVLTHREYDRGRWK